MPEETTTLDVPELPSYVDEVAKLAIASTEAKPVELVPGKQYAVAVPQGYTLEQIDLDLDKHRDRPRRKTGRATVHDAMSFIAYLDKHGLPETEVWADYSTQQLVAVINAHRAADDEEEATIEGAPGWGDHRVRLALFQTPQWMHWARFSRKAMGQQDFAEHFEERILDVIAPPGAEMMEILQTFKATNRMQFESGTRLSTGQHQITYHEEIEAKAGKRGQLQIPETFNLALQPFEGSDPYQVGARLRYRINDGQLALTYVLDRPDEVLRSAFVDIVTKVAGGITHDVHAGVPTEL